MSTWNTDTLTAITENDDLHIAPFRADGVTHGTPTWIWNVRVGDDLYVRAYNGTSSRWYQSAQSQRAGIIKAAGGTHDVAFEPIEPTGYEQLNDQVDEAYKAKYSTSPYLAPMISEKVRAATVRVAPRNGDG